MGKESAERIQTSILSKAEKKALVWLAQRQPEWMTSDTLTYIGVLGTVVYAIGGWLSNTDIRYLWLSSFGLVLHWYGDSLDGTLARFRNTQRPIYGFFIDHTLDAVTTCLIFLGAGLSPMFRMDVALAALAGYLSLYTSWSEWRINWYGLEWGIFDILGIIITIILFSIYIAQFIKDRAAFAKQDPLKPHNKR